MVDDLVFPYSVILVEDIRRKQHVFAKCRTRWAALLVCRVANIEHSSGCMYHVHKGPVFEQNIMG